MAGQIRMTPETMRARASQTDRQAETMESVIKSMDNLLTTLKGEWEGDAVKGYEERYNNIKPHLTKAKELLGEIASNLRATAKIVEETDTSIGNQFRK